MVMLPTATLYYYFMFEITAQSALSKLFSWSAVSDHETLLPLLNISVFILSGYDWKGRNTFVVMMDQSGKEGLAIT